jgi:ABC-type multidrug transport system, ATPase and permease components
MSLDVCSDGVVGPFTTLFSRSVLILSISISLFFINFFVTSILFLFFILGYLTLFNLVKKKLNKINLSLSLHEKNRYKYADDTFSGIKEIKISLAENIFKKLFAKESDGYAYSQSLSLILAQFPRFIFETISIFIIVIFSTGFLFLFSKENFTSIIPLISVYAFAGFKILPSLQLIYFSIATIKSNQNSIDIIYDDLASEIGSNTNNKKYLKNDNFININNTIEFKNISFNYPTKKIMKNLNLKLLKGEIIGIYGKSGVGKSTLIDLIMGLIKFEKGEVLIDEIKSEIFENPEWLKI